MNYCAVSLRTESGDDYVFLIEYNTYEDITNKVLDSLGEEAEWVYTWSVDTGSSTEENEAVDQAVADAIKQSENTNEEEE